MVFDLDAFGPQCGEFGLWPVGVAYEAEVAVFFGVQGGEACGESLGEAGDPVELGEDGGVELVSDLGAELLAQAGGGEVEVNGGFDVVDLQAAEVAVTVLVVVGGSVRASWYPCGIGSGRFGG